MMLAACQNQGMISSEEGEGNQHDTVLLIRSKSLSLHYVYFHLSSFSSQRQSNIITKLLICMVAS